MKRQKVERHALRKPALILSVVLLGLLFFLGSAYQYQRHQSLSLRQAITTYNKVKQQLALAQQAQADYVQFLPEYQSLVERGFVGEEQRRHWVERLRQVREQYDLFEIDYDISKQQVYQPSYLVEKSESHQLYRSVMTLKLELLHGGDLFNLLSGLQQNTSPFMVRDCEVIRVTDTGAVNLLQTNLKARCEIDWLTLKPLEIKEDV